jgi:exo-1,4-beta-D-glucosaminidase
MQEFIIEIFSKIRLIIPFLVICMSSINAESNLESSFSKGWVIFSSEKINSDGEQISTIRFKADESYKTDIPKTIFAALVDNGVYQNPYYGENLLNISQKPFQKPWWYRKEFNIDEIDNANYQITLEGVNYKANLWINGRKVAGNDKIEGVFGRFNFDITKYINKGENVIAIEVFPPKWGDFTLGFVDWNPSPPDNNMGLWRGVKLKKTGKVSLDNIFVITKVNKKTLDEAELTIEGKLTNFSNDKIEVEIKGSFDKNRKFSKSVLLQPKSESEFAVSSEDNPDLKVLNPRLWWPNNLGDPYLYNLSIEADIDNEVSDEQNVKFGIREVEDYINERGHRGYTINGKKILIKGAGWVDDMMLNDSDEKVMEQVKYARHMNLNALRCEGFWGRDEALFNAADENGILIMIGWSCQWDWKGYCGREESKYSCVTSPEDISLISKEFNDQVVWLRNHPSIFVWALGSDKYPNPELMKKTTEYLNKSDTTRPRLISTQWIKVTKEENADNIYEDSKVKMFGPYAYEPPVYWYSDTSHGGAYGFNTETGPGPQVPPIETLKKMMSNSDLWPIDSVWAFHCGRHEFGNLDHFLKIFNNRYGKASSLEDFAMKCQMSNYEAMRPMFESFGVNKFISTGVIQWMFNSAWPEMYWQLFDYYLMPNGAFYGAMKGCQPLNIVYNYKDKNIYVVNDFLKSFNNIRASVKIFDTDSKLLYEKEKEISIEENSSKKIIDLPEFKDKSNLYFISLELKDSANNLISNNFYWVSAKEDILDSKSSEWFYTPVKSCADLKDINHLPAASINYSEKFTSENDKQNIEVTIENTSDKIAFFIELKVENEKTGQSFLPIYWTDNYISILPHSKKIVKGTFQNPLKEKPKLIVNGWNIQQTL